MAGDWIKMRSDLLTHPKVVRIMSALKADKLRVIGGLHAVWCLFDMHSADGVLDGYTTDILDSHLGWPGFSAEMAKLDKWHFVDSAKLEFLQCSLRLPCSPCGVSWCGKSVVRCAARGTNPRCICW